MVFPFLKWHTNATSPPPPSPPPGLSLLLLMRWLGPLFGFTFLLFVNSFSILSSHCFFSFAKMGFSKAIVLLSLLALFYGTIGTSDDETEKDGGANEVLTSADDATDNEVEGTRTAQKRKHTMAQKEETEDKKFFSALERFVNDTVKRPLQEVADEFTIPGSPQNFSQCAQKKECNRYEDIICVEETEVRLNNGRYIHANWIEFNGEKRFICTQGPLVSTSKDFWTMVVQENIQSIVMLCNTVEDAKDKCAQYWPTAENEVLSFDKNQQITVKFEKEQLVEGTVYRTDLIVYAPQMGQGVLHVKHFHWREWPDHGVPKNDLALFHLLEHIQEVQQSVVHCSAGVGRTGTLVVISLAIQTLHLGLPLDISTLVCEIRQQRAQSVQKLGQYLYIYFVILNYAKNNASKLKLENTDSFNAFLKELEGMISRG